MEMGPVFHYNYQVTAGGQNIKETKMIISEAAFREMKANPEYREKVLSPIQRDWGDSYAPRRYHVLITVGADLKDYRASPWPVSNSSRCKSSRRYVKKKIYKKRGKKKVEKKVYIEEYIEGKMMVRRLVQILRKEEAEKEMLLRRYKELREY